MPTVYMQSGSVLYDDVDGTIGIDPNCCCGPGCSVVCDQISANKSKCGYPEFAGYESTPPKFYLTKVETYDRSCSHVDGQDGPDDPPSPHGNVVDEYHMHRTSTIDPVTCEETVVQTCSGSSHYYMVTGFCNGCQVVDDNCTCMHDTSCVGGCNDNYGPCNADFAGSGWDCGAGTTVTSTSSVEHCDLYAHVPDPPFLPTFPGSGGTLDITTTLSNEYTTGTLITNTVGDLPPYDDDYNDICSASRNLSTNESSYSISRFKPKFTIPSPVGDSTSVSYNEHFVPDVGSPVDTPRTLTISAGQVEIIGDEVTEPDENGTITITDLQCVAATGACCINATCGGFTPLDCNRGGQDCVDIHKADCDSRGGVFSADMHCSSNPCIPLTGSCCDASYMCCPGTSGGCCGGLCCGGSACVNPAYFCCGSGPHACPPTATCCGDGSCCGGFGGGPFTCCAADGAGYNCCGFSSYCCGDVNGTCCSNGAGFSPPEDCCFNDLGAASCVPSSQGCGGTAFDFYEIG